MIQRLVNIASTVTSPARLAVLVNKVRARVTREEPTGDHDRLMAWCAERAQDYATWAERADPDLWAEARGFADTFEASARERLSTARIQFGGGGAFAFLYFLVRLKRPVNVLETGVAAGWSSSAILSALDRNGEGHLWSSDFPYFRQAKAEDEIGILVDERLKGRWTLMTDGDRTNLPALIARMPSIDFLHYDSDKTAKGRTFALDQAGAKLASDAVILFDDIQDNWHFRDRFGASGLIFEERGKYVGALGL